MTKFGHFGLFIYRLILGTMMIKGHGLIKLTRLLEGNMEFPDPIGIGASTSLVLTICAEVLGSILVMAGFHCRFAAFSVTATLCVAGLLVHAQDPFFPEFVSKLSEAYPYLLTPSKEYALLYALSFGILIFVGPGKFSIDKASSKSTANN